MNTPVIAKALVKTIFPGNPFDIQATTNAVILLSNNTVQLKGNYVLDNFLHNEADRDALYQLYTTTPTVSLEAATGEDGKADTRREAPLMLCQYAYGAYDPRKMGKLALLDRNKLIIMHSHYHTSKKVEFVYNSFKLALTEYCQLATLEGRRKDPIIVPMPGMDCDGVKAPVGENAWTVDQYHMKRVIEIIETTMFPEADVTLVIPG